MDNKMICSKCKKRPAVIFVSKIEGEKTTQEGFCIICAMDLNIGLRPGAAEIYGKVATLAFYVVMVFIIGFGPEVGAFRNLFTIPNTLMMILVIISAILTMVAFFSYIPDVIRQVKEKKNKAK